jgi:hypothetical protein
MLLCSRILRDDYTPWRAACQAAAGGGGRPARGGGPGVGRREARRPGHCVPPGSQQRGSPPSDPRGPGRGRPADPGGHDAARLKPACTAYTRLEPPLGGVSRSQGACLPPAWGEPLARGRRRALVPSRSAARLRGLPRKSRAGAPHSTSARRARPVFMPAGVRPGARDDSTSALRRPPGPPSLLRALRASVVEPPPAPAG